MLRRFRVTMCKNRQLWHVVYVCAILLMLCMIYQMATMRTGAKEISARESRPLQHSDPTLMIDDSRAQALARRPGGRILCWILSIPTAMASKVNAVNGTWLKRCDGHLIFIEDVPPPIPADVVSLDVPRGYYNLTAKVVIILNYLYTNYRHQYDWFLKGDDDAYVVVENLRYILSLYKATQPVYLGHLFKRIVLPGGFMSGGATYVLSQEALRVVVENGFQKNICKTKGSPEDVDVGRCLQKVGVRPHNSRDRFGRDTFHPLAPHVHIVGPIPANQIPQDHFTMVSGDDCCSQLMVSFHKVNPSMMKLIDHLLYRTSVYGRVLDTEALDDLDLVEPKVVPPLTKQSK